MRKAGMLMPVGSLPSRHGVGDFGKNAYEFIDLLQQAHFTIWQILPLNPLGYGNSPYQPYSSYAGDEIYISLDELKKEGLLKTVESHNPKAKRIDYEDVRKFKEKYLHEAFFNFKKDKAYEEFVKENDWVYKYAVFLTLKKKNNLVCWNEWSKEERDWIKDNKFDLTKYENDIEYEMFIQYKFYTQWIKLKEYANSKGIKVMGDIPFYVGIDSLDVWDNQECFLLGADSKPTFIAGVPPDYFSETGQRWGNPIYDWDYLKKTRYDFWVKRLSYCAKIFDIIRIDHFRAFDTYWKIPSSCETAIDGEWIEAPGYDLFDTVLPKIKGTEIVVEDLGDLREEVLELRDHYNFKGMKVVQFTFDPNENNNNFKDRENMVIYTGTHDNDTIRGWYRSQKESVRKNTRKALEKMGYNDKDISVRFLRYTFDSIASLAVVPMQDVINLSSEGRINVPGTLGSPNWEWKLDSFKKFKEKIPVLAQIIK